MSQTYVIASDPIFFYNVLKKVRFSVLYFKNEFRIAGAIQKTIEVK